MRKALVAALLCLPAGAQDVELPSLARNWTAHGGHPRLLGPYGQVLVRRDGTELELRAQQPNGTTLIARGPLAPDADGFYVFKGTIPNDVGAVGRLLGEVAGPASPVELRFRENAGSGRFQGQELIDGKLVRHPTLIRRRRAFIGYSSLRKNEELPSIQFRSLQAAWYYTRNGYSVRREKLDNVEELISELQAASQDPYDRVIIISHAGRDGPVLGWSWPDMEGPPGTRQTGPDYQAEHWPGLVEAVRIGTTDTALVFTSGCNTARDKWVQTLASQSGRTVVGPVETSSWWKTTTHIRALEGEGETEQELIWAHGSEHHSIGTKQKIEGTIPAAAMRKVDLKLGEAAPHPDTGVRGAVMRTAEGARSESIMERLSEWRPLIEKHAATRQQADLMRAIVFEEQVHQNPPWLEEVAEGAGFGQTVGPSQIHVGLWAESYGVTREQLRDPDTHFRVMRQHLDLVTERARAAGLGDSPAAIGSVWNHIEARSITNYGRRVERFYLLFAQRSGS